MRVHIMSDFMDVSIFVLCICSYKCLRNKSYWFSTLIKCARSYYFTYYLNSYREYYFTVYVT